MESHLEGTYYGDSYKVQNMETHIKVHGMENHIQGTICRHSNRGYNV